MTRAFAWPRPPCPAASAARTCARSIGRLGAPRPRQMFETLDPVVRRRGVGARRVPQAPALARNRRPHGRGQRVDGALAQHLLHHRRRDHLRSPASRRPAHDHFPADRRQLRGQVRHAGFIRMVNDHPADRLRLESDVARARRRPPCLGGARRRRSRRQCRFPERRQLLVHQHGQTVRGAVERCRQGRRRLRRQTRRRRSPGLVEGSLQQVLLPDGHLLLLGVARQLDHGEALAHRLRYRARIGRRHDPQGAGQVERDIEVRVPELGATCGVEQIEQRVGGLRPHPVEFLEDEDRVVHPGLAQAPDDSPGGAARQTSNHRRGVGHAQRHAHVGAADCLGDGHGQ